MAQTRNFNCVLRNGHYLRALATELGQVPGKSCRTTAFAQIHISGKRFTRHNPDIYQHIPIYVAKIWVCQGRTTMNPNLTNGVRSNWLSGKMLVGAVVLVAALIPSAVAQDNRERNCTGLQDFMQQFEEKLFGETHPILNRHS
jgi:hypothetical protein